MGFFSRFRRAASALDFGHSVSDPSILAFHSLDVERTQDNLGLIEIAKDRGSRNMPPADSQGMDDIEYKIVAEIDQRKNLSFNSLSSNQRAYRDRIKSLANRSELEQLGMAVESAISGFATKKQTARNDLYPMRKDVIEYERALNDFRAKHRLARPSRRPESKWWCWGVLGIIALVEITINGLLFARGDDMGYIGGLSKAALTAFINIAIGWTLGRYTLPNLFHRNWFRKFLGFVFSMIVLAAIPAFNLLVAHYRAALGGDNPELADQAALASFLAAPFGIVEVQGWILVGLGLIFSFIAAGDGWYYDDPYPGYGAVFARHRIAMDDYSGAMEDAIEDINEIREDAEKAITACSQKVSAQENQFHMLIDEANRMSRLFEAHLDHLEHAGNALLAAYRNENAKWRSDKVPAHFSSRWSLQRPSVEPMFQFPESIRDAIAKTVAEAPQEGKASREKLHQHYREAILEHERIDQLTAADLANVNA